MFCLPHTDCRYARGGSSTHDVDCSIDINEVAIAFTVVGAAYLAGGVALLARKKEYTQVPII